MGRPLRASVSPSFSWSWVLRRPDPGQTSRWAWGSVWEKRFGVGTSLVSFRVSPPTSLGLPPTRPWWFVDNRQRCGNRSFVDSPSLHTPAPNPPCSIAVPTSPWWVPVHPSLCYRGPTSEVLFGRYPLGGQGGVRKLGEMEVEDVSEARQASLSTVEQTGRGTVLHINKGSCTGSPPRVRER